MGVTESAKIFESQDAALLRNIWKKVYLKCLFVCIKSNGVVLIGNTYDPLNILKHNPFRLS